MRIRPSLMQYENITQFNDGEFKCLMGVSRPLFLNMVSALQQTELAKENLVGLILCI